MLESHSYMVRNLYKICGGLWPLVMFPLFYWLTSEGHLDFGGGEKDIILVVPLAVYSLIYLILYMVVLKFAFPLLKAFVFSILGALVLLVLIGMALGPSIMGINW